MEKTLHFMYYSAYNLLSASVTLNTILLGTDSTVSIYISKKFKLMAEVVSKLVCCLTAPINGKA